MSGETGLKQSGDTSQVSETPIIQEGRDGGTTQVQTEGQIRPSGGGWSRRRVLFEAATIAAAFVLPPSLAGCGGDKDSLPKPDDYQPKPPALPDKLKPPVKVYLPTWLTDEDYNRIARVTSAEQVGRQIVSFAVPQPGGGLQVPEIAHGSRLQQVKDIGPAGLAIGGWGGSDQDHADILQGWNHALANPKEFAEHVAEAVKINNANGTLLDNVDLDFEYPTPDQAAGFVRLVEYLRGLLPNEISISLAVPALTADAGGFLFSGRASGLEPLVSAVHIMTYDHAGPWSEVAGHLAPGQWVVDCVTQWAEKVDPAKLWVGYPTYASRFPGAQKPGDEFAPDGHEIVSYTELIKSGAVIYDDLVGTNGADGPTGPVSWTFYEGSWTTCMSPGAIRATHQLVTERVRGIGGGVFWDAKGLTREHLQAIRTQE